MLSTGEQVGWTTIERAGKYLCEGEIVAIPWGKSRPVKEILKYYKGKFVTADNRIVTSSDKNILLNKYLYFWMQSKSNEIDKFYRGSGIQHPNMSQILDMDIQLPSIAVQRRIVNILDKFEMLSNSLVEGLPAEIEARREQYEYYRDLLLDFRPESSIGGGRT